MIGEDVMKKNAVTYKGDGHFLMLKTKNILASTVCSMVNQLYWIRNVKNT